MRKFLCRGCLGLVLLLAVARTGAAQEDQGRAGLSDAAALGRTLLRDHRNLVPEDRRAELGRLADRAGEAIQRVKDGVPPTTGESAADSGERLLDRLGAFLDSLTAVVRVEVVDGLPRTVSRSPSSLPGDRGAVLLRIAAGDGGSHFVTTSHDLSDGSESVQIAVAGRGVTWALVGLMNVPPGPSSLLFKFEGVIERWIPFLWNVTAPKPGRLRINILDEKGTGSTPAMVRLVWDTDGHVRRPGNAILLAPQFDGQGEPDDPRQANLPGRLEGAYWCVPESFDMAVSPGTWSLTIRRGIEHVPVFDTIRVESGQRVEKTYQVRRFVDMRKLGWYSGDGHIHGRLTSDRDAEQLLTWVRAEDIHLANVLKMGDINRTYFQQRGFGPDYRVLDGDYALVPGQECPRSYEQLGHTVAWNTRRMVRDTSRYYLYDEAMKALRADGAVTGYAHVESNHFEVDRDMSLNVPKGLADFVEILQFGRLGTDLYYGFLNLGFKLTAAAGSDVPWGGSIGEVRMYAYLGDTAFSPDAWFAAVKRGRTFVTNGLMIDLRVDEAFPGDELAATDGRHVRVRARAWGHAKGAIPGRLDVVVQGEVVRSASPRDVGITELSLDFTLPAQNGFWVAASAEGEDGSAAHTTPVYVVRSSLRFWKHEEVDELIGKRMESLADIERLVRTARQLDRQGSIEYHRPWKQLALQSAALLDRVEAARRFYEGLEQTAREERALRQKR